jgi:hypothetical protein
MPFPRTVIPRILGTLSIRVENFQEDIVRERSDGSTPLDYTVRA